MQEQAKVDAARAALEQELGPANILSDPLALRLYGRDASMVEGGCALVAFPRSAEDIVACVRAATRFGLPVVPRGAGTGLAGGSTPIGDALVVVTTKMNRILEVRPQDRLAWVEPGVLNLDLANALAPLGFTFAPDPSSQQTCTLGGNVNTNAGGPHCLAYGVTSNHVLALDVVLADGSVERLGSEGPEWAGYDLRGLMVGSEGTLGVVAAVCVRLTPLPPAVRTMLLDFGTVSEGAATVSAIIASGAVPAALEMMDHGIVVAAENFAHAGYPTDAAAILIVEVDGLDEAVDAQAHAVEEAGRANAVRTIRVAADDVERALIWKGRKSAFGAVAQIAPHYHLHDCVVPRTKLVEVLAGVYEIVERHALIVTNVFHAGDGNLHPLISFDRRVPGTLERVLRASDEIVRLCIGAGGALSGEHGIGLEKRDFMPLVFTADDLGAQACLREAFDPAGLMNPQKVLPSGARCGDFAVAGESAGDAAAAAASVPEGSWI
jgi:glycolate oxidase